MSFTIKKYSEKFNLEYPWETVHGFIKDDPNAVKKYKDENSHEWADILGQGTYSVQEDNSEWDEKETTTDLFENED